MLQSRRLRESVLLALGVITPLGILAVNVSAFVMAHLTQFRIGIAALALLSGLVLNGLTAWWLLRLASRSAAPLFAEYRRWAIGAAVLIVALTAAGGGYLTYLGMRDPRRLPDTLSMVVATFMLAAPSGGDVRGPADGRPGRHHPGRRPRRKREEPPAPARGSFGPFFLDSSDYIMSGDIPPMPPPPLLSSGISVTIASVVSTIAAIDAAF